MASTFVKWSAGSLVNASRLNRSSLFFSSQSHGSLGFRRTSSVFTRLPPRSSPESLTENVVSQIRPSSNSRKRRLSCPGIPHTTARGICGCELPSQSCSRVLSVMGQRVVRSGNVDSGIRPIARFTCQDDRNIKTGSKRGWEVAGFSDLRGPVGAQARLAFDNCKRTSRIRRGRVPVHRQV